MRNLSSALPSMPSNRNSNPPLEGRDQYLRAIYNAYPRHVGKREALKAFDRALYRLEFEEKSDIPEAFWKMADGLKPADYLLEMVRIYASSPAGKKGNFTPHPSTWANQSRYFDDVMDWFRPEGGSNAKQQTFAERDAAGTREAIARVRQDRQRASSHVNALGSSSERRSSGPMAQRLFPLPDSGD